MAGEGDIFSGMLSGGAGGTSAMPGWGTAVGAGLGLVGGVFSYLGKQSQVAAMRAQAEEELRRRKMQDAQVLGQATAAGAASGVDFESTSLQSYLGSMQAEMKRQQEWQRKSAATNAGNMSTASTVGLFTDMGGTLSSFAKANNYWRTG